MESCARLNTIKRVERTPLRSGTGVHYVACMGLANHQVLPCRYRVYEMVQW